MVKPFKPWKAMWSREISLNLLASKKKKNWLLRCIVSWSPSHTFGKHAWRSTFFQYIGKLSNFLYFLKFTLLFFDFIWTWCTDPSTHGLCTLFLCSYIPLLTGGFSWRWDKPLFAHSWWWIWSLVLVQAHCYTWRSWVHCGCNRFIWFWHWFYWS